MADEVSHQDETLLQLAQTFGPIPLASDVSVRFHATIKT